ncbi:putative suppression of tumorigenicity [Hibiscus syriacus]|uniref:Suppression of tumorigenicity n=1 Tax=Hibiscus syriacus TaxID=106335 RepID=A0A6A2Z1C6_HIBSY|nr:putative suppression of tumorigenicity [Hibiscus syriacus]
MISESLAAKHHSWRGFSSKVGYSEKNPDISNIEEVELSLRESSSLNYEEARALHGRIEYQKGNIEAALHEFGGINIAAITPKMKLTLSRRVEQRKRRSHDHASPQMSIHAVSLLLEAIFLKAKSLQHLQRFREAAQTSEVILDIVESSIPQGLPENFGADCKLNETLNKAVELLPELWKCSDSPREAILSYRRALLYQWNLDVEATARIQKQFAIFLLYYGGEDLVALNLLRKLFSIEDPCCVPALLMASKICAEKPNLAEEGINFARRALESLDDKCSELEGTGNYLLGVAQSTHSKSAVSDFEMVASQSEALQALKRAGNITSMKDPNILYYLSLQNAEQRKLEAALYYAKSLLKLEGGSNIKGWLLLVRVLSAQKRFADSETILDAALDQTGKWDQRELLRTKAKLQTAQGHLKGAVDTYTRLLGIVHVQSKSFSSGKKLYKDRGCFSRSFEQEIWHDLAYLYVSLSRWQDAEICLSKSKAISSFSAVRNHATGVIYERKGLPKEALTAFWSALDIDHDHSPSLISAAGLLRDLGSQSGAVVKNLLMNAVGVDRMNPLAWYNLGMLLKDENTPSSLEEAAECFQAAAILEDSAPAS